MTIKQLNIQLEQREIRYTLIEKEKIRQIDRLEKKIKEQRTEYLSQIKEQRTEYLSQIQKLEDTLFRIAMAH